MSQFDIGSLAVMEHGELVGMLTFREIIHTLARNGGALGEKTVRTVMDDHPMSCTPETELEQVRPMMLERHTRYMPVMDNKMLMGVISFYDVAKAVVDSQNFENKMLKAYIRDWPAEDEAQPALRPADLNTPHEKRPASRGVFHGAAADSAHRAWIMSRTRG